MGRQWNTEGNTEEAVGPTTQVSVSAKFDSNLFKVKAMGQQRHTPVHHSAESENCTSSPLTKVKEKKHGKNRTDQTGIRGQVDVVLAAADLQLGQRSAATGQPLEDGRCIKTRWVLWRNRVPDFTVPTRFRSMRLATHRAGR